MSGPIINPFWSGYTASWIVPDGSKTRPNFHLPFPIPPPLSAPMIPNLMKGSAHA